jgi:hypothetical protein
MEIYACHQSQSISQHRGDVDPAEVRHRREFL